MIDAGNPWLEREIHLLFSVRISVADLTMRTGNGESFYFYNSMIFND